jgi:hypothetical protein
LTITGREHVCIVHDHQTHPLVREGAPQKQDGNLPAGSNIWSQVPEWARHQDILTDQPSVVKKLDFDYIDNRIRPPKSLLTLNGHNIPFVNSIKYLCMIFDKRITRRLHVETVTRKANRTFIILYYLLKSDGLSTNSKLTLHKAIIRSIMTYACPTWKFAADTQLMKLRRLQNKVFHTTGKFARNTPIRDMHISFQISHVYDFITKLCEQQPKVIQNHDNNLV